MKFIEQQLHHKKNNTSDKNNCGPEGAEGQILQTKLFLSHFLKIANTYTTNFAAVKKVDLDFFFMKLNLECYQLNSN